MARRRKLTDRPIKKKDTGYGMKHLRLGMEPIRKNWEFHDRLLTSYLKLTEIDGTTYIIEKDRTFIFIEPQLGEFRSYSDGRNTFRNLGIRHKPL
jgi:hypothetical protein